MASYGMTDDGIFKDGEQLTNFTAQIEKQIKRHDGKKCETWLVVSGKVGETELPPVTIPATQFASFTWVPQHWGVEPIIYPLSNCEKDLRCSIQELSEPETVDLYTHTGWSKINGKVTYLHGGGGVDQDGVNSDVNVELPHDLRHYRLDPGSKQSAKSAFRNSLNLSTLAPPEISWPLVLSAYRSAVDETDFALHLSGRTGTFKSEFCSLIQSHFGSGMDARHLPASWSSTANALECQCYAAKDAICVIDDFVPNGTTWQVRGLQKTADQLLRGQGNQAGRARLTDTSNLQTTYYPRGVILSTGEDIPNGHSIRARMLIMDLSPGDITSQKLTEAQEKRSSYPQAMHGWIKHLAGDLTGIRKRIQDRATTFRDGHRDLGHARTPQMIGQLQATLEELLRYGMAKKYISVEEGAKLAIAGETGLMTIAEQQTQYMREADPADSFCELIKQLIGGHLCHLRSRSGGIPDNPESFGWTEMRSLHGIPSYKASGPTIGWHDDQAEEILIDQNQFPFIQKHSNGKLSLSRQTMLKRLKDAGVLSRTDELRNRNTMRIMCGGAQRSVLTIPQQKIFGDLQNGK